MNTLIDTPQKAEHRDGFIIVEMSSGTILRFPVSDHERLRSASHEELSDIDLSPFGLHWSQLNEDLSIRGLQANNKNGLTRRSS
jgi:hypothetical protein